MSFVHLHTHSHYSILEGLPKPKEYAKKAAALGMKAVALTDTGNIHGCHEFYKYCKEAGVKPILGAEIFVVSELDPKLSHGLVLLAKSLRGYKNILKLVSRASLDNPGQTPQIDFSVMIELKEQIENKDLEIVCLSGSTNSEIAYYILSGKNDSEILARIKQYQTLFGEENYYLELQVHDDIPKQRTITERSIELHHQFAIPVVATNNSYYIEKEDKHTQDIIMALGKGYEIENPDRPTLIAGDYSFLCEEEMQMLFGYLPSAIENTGKIADMVDIEIPMGVMLLPKFTLPEEDQKIYDTYMGSISQRDDISLLESDEWYLRYLSFIGLNWRFDFGLTQEVIFEFIHKLSGLSLGKNLTESSPDELKDYSTKSYTSKKQQLLAGLDEEKNMYIERLEYELTVIHEMGFDGYFLIVADYIGWARKNGVPVGPGRGSAAGSLMAYLSGITDLDPTKYGLLFERFLNPARISMPDIDTDFSDEGRDRVVDYCRQKYGEDHVAQVCTFGTFAARAAVKDVGRVKGIPFSEMNELAKLIPEKPGTKLQGALDETPEFKQAYETNPVYKDIIDNALKIEGNVRQLGVHACAVIIAPQPMTEFTALARPPKDAQSIVTQYSAYPLEDLGLLKMDFLGLRTLTIIQKTLEIVKKSKGDEIQMDKLDMVDQKVFDVFAAGDTTGVFQFESSGMRKYLKDLKPNSFEDLIAMVSLYRPGPLAYIPTYIERKYGKEVEYMTEALQDILKKKYSPKQIQEQQEKLEADLKKILDVTYGIAVYQEQLMFIVQYMAGFSLGEADLLRRGVGKKIASVIEKLKGEFIDKSETFRGYKPEVSRFIYEEMIQPAANYSFNKSHAACYAYIAYQTAYLKAYFPTEFLTALMTTDEENMDRITLEVGEAQSKDIEILPPDVNESLMHFTYIDDNNIRFGLKAIKGIGEGPIEAIIQNRQEGPYVDINDFLTRAGKEVINKKSLESLILSGAIDAFGDRKTLYDNIEDMIRFSRNEDKKKESSQIGLFDMGGSDFEENFVLIAATRPFSFEEKLFKEKEVLGFMVSGHPLDSLKNYCQRRSNNTRFLKMSIEELAEIKEKTPEQFEKDTANIILKATGIIVDIRKIVTKTGKNMMFLMCEGFDYDFEVTIYQKDFEDYKNKVGVGKIIIIDGQLTINLEYGRKSINLRNANMGSLTQVRAQARDMGLLDNSRRLALQAETRKNEEVIPSAKTDSDTPEPSKETADFDGELEQKIEEHTGQTPELVHEQEKYIIKIPAGTKIEQIHALKDFLGSQDPGSIALYILLAGNEIDTKMSVRNVEKVKEWERGNLIIQ